jgi:hypothetical protein
MATVEERLNSVEALQGRQEIRLATVEKKAQDYETRIGLLEMAPKPADVVKKWGAAAGTVVKKAIPYGLVAVAMLFLTGTWTIPGCPGPVPPAPEPPAPKPEPVPPNPKPTPIPPAPAPIPSPGFRVLVVYDTASITQMPKGQQAVLYDKSIRDYMNAKCTVGQDGKTREWRMFDANTSLKGESDIWKNALARPRQSLPWIIISNGTTGFEGPLPATVEDTMKLLKQYGG